MTVYYYLYGHSAIHNNIHLLKNVTIQKRVKQLSSIIIHISFIHYKP